MGLMLLSCSCRSIKTMQIVQEMLGSVTALVVPEIPNKIVTHELLGQQLDEMLPAVMACDITFILPVEINGNIVWKVQSLSVPIRNQWNKKGSLYSGKNKTHVGIGMYGERVCI